MALLKAVVLLDAVEVVSAGDHGPLHLPVAATPDRVCPQTSEGHALSMQVPSMASVGVLKPRLRFLEHCVSLFLTVSPTGPSPYLEGWWAH